MSALGKRGATRAAKRAGVGDRQGRPARSPWSSRSYVATNLILVAAFVGVGVLFRTLAVRDTAEYFPMSMFFGPKVAWRGLPYAAGFVAVIWVALRLKLSPFRVWLVGLALIALGNMAQGGPRVGIVRPVYIWDRQYYNEAVKVDDSRAWLASFTENQPSFNPHTQTHPPFAVLLHHVIGGRIAIGVVFTILTSLSVPLLWRTICVSRASPPGRAFLLSVLFAVVPSVNIYGAVSLDAIVMVTSLVSLLGLVMLLREDRWNWAAFLLFAGGVLASNALNFGSLFLLAVAAFWLRRRNVRLVMSLTVVLGLAAYAALRFGYGYDHVAAFLNASRLENPHGFRLIAAPVHYLMTRVENVGNIAFFLSVPVLALLVRRQLHPLTRAALALLALMFLAGVYRTGETARACLYLVPFVFLSLGDVEAPFIRWLIWAAGIQTILMQVVGNFSW